MIQIENIIAAICAVCFVMLAGYYVLRSIVVGLLEVPQHLFNAAFSGGVGCGTLVFLPLVAAGVAKALGLW